MKAPYQVDLSRHMAECDANYWRLSRLMPDLATVSGRAFGLTLRNSAMAQVAIEVIERARYTTTLRVSHLAEFPWLRVPEILVRMYHDARTAEVLACRDERPREGRYSYPNERMYHIDEKAQINAFLGEWLSHCLDHGHSLEDACRRVY